MARKTGRKLLDRRPVAQLEVQVTTIKISAPKTGINTKKQTFIKNVSKSGQLEQPLYAKNPPQARRVLHRTLRGDFRPSHSQNSFTNLFKL